MWIIDALTNLIKNKGPISRTWVLPAFNTNVQTIYVARKAKSSDGIFGRLSCDYNTFKCETVEKLAKAIAPGRYKVTFDVSPHMGYLTPHLAVPDRDKAAGGDAGIRVHKANEPKQLEGCIALGQCGDDSIGECVADDSVQTSKIAFDEFMLLTDKAKETWIEVSEAYGG